MIWCARGGAFPKGSLAAVGLVAVLVYVNTLVADFTFDDNFAVITNGDVTNDAIPTKDLFKHDFWGQDITSSQSHKSYRPITILAFRLTHKAWGLITAAAPAITQLVPHPPALLPGQDPDNGKTERPPGLHPFPFHVLCVCMHAIASMMVSALCQHLFAVLEEGSSPHMSQAAAAVASVPASTSAQQTGQSRESGWQQLLMWREQPQLWHVPVRAKFRAQAFLAALMFALHPIHTEAVAGVVGCAELICAAMSCPALLLYFMAVDGRYAAARQSRQQQDAAAGTTTAAASARSRNAPNRPVSGNTAQHHKAAAVPATAGGGTTAWQQQALPHVADALQHWLLVLAAAVLAFCAALSKEIGITVIGTMLLYDLLLAPHFRQGLPSQGSGGGSRELQTQQSTCRRQLLRMLCIAATAVAYVSLRQWIAVRQLVTIYRKVENPIPFAPSRLTRAMSTGYLHARYFWLLLLPLRLSADWSFSCIPLVEHWADARNLATLALYCYFLYVAWSAQPLRLLQQLLVCLKCAAAPEAPDDQSSTGVKAANGATPIPCDASGVTAAGSTAQHTAALAGAGRARWRAMVLVGLVVAPFFPASNVLFYVGTFIGERLLYVPSIGFCLLASELIGALIPDPSQPQQGQTQQQVQDPATEQVRTTSAGLHGVLGGACSPRQQPQGPSAGQVRQQEAAGAGTPAPGLNSSKSSTQQQGALPVPSLPARSRSVLVLLCVVLLCGYAGRTVVRNMDWWDDERLFLAALRVCPNSAKVQQNCGVLQRRYNNYTAALEHFRRAQAIEPGYCEPSYWIGLTVLNNGDAAGGLAAIKASLPCKYTAADALTALNKLYLMMMEAGKGSDPAPMLAWAGVLSSPHVLRVADACATAEDAALGAALSHKSINIINAAVDVCLSGIAEWEHGTVQPDTLGALTKQRLTGLNTTLLSECVVMRRAVYRQLAGNAVDSWAVRRAVYRYISRVTKRHPDCRTTAGGGPISVDGEASPAVVPSSHQKLLHKVQGADPNDPWLQAEWAATLLALGPHSQREEAGMHVGVAAAIFNQVAQQLMAQGAGRSGGVQPEQQQQGVGRVPGGEASSSAHLTQLDGKTPLTPLSALQAAIQRLEAFLSAADGRTGRAAGVQVCELWQRLCHIKLQVVALLQHQTAGGAAAGSSGQSARQAVQEASAAGQQCLKELFRLKGCEAHAAELQKVLRLK